MLTKGTIRSLVAINRCFNKHQTTTIFAFQKYCCAIHSINLPGSLDTSPLLGSRFLACRLLHFGSEPLVSEPLTGAPFLSAHQQTPRLGVSCVVVPLLGLIDPRHWTGLQKPVSGSQRGWNQVLGWPARLAAIAFLRRNRSHWERTGQTPLQACSLWNRFFDGHTTVVDRLTGTHLFSRGLNRHLVVVMVSRSLLLLDRCVSEARQLDSIDSKQTSPGEDEQWIY